MPPKPIPACCLLLLAAAAAAVTRPPSFYNFSPKVCVNNPADNNNATFNGCTNTQPGGTCNGRTLVVDRRVTLIQSTDSTTRSPAALGDTLLLGSNALRYNTVLQPARCMSPHPSAAAVELLLLQRTPGGFTLTLCLFNCF